MKEQTEDKKLDELLTDLDPPYESMGDLRIGRILDQYSIPFFYKQATIVYDQGQHKIWHPTFTTLDYGGLVIDYVPENGQGSKHRVSQRQTVYDLNQIPAVVLDVKELANPNWQERLYDHIQQAQRIHPKKYMPVQGYN